MTHHNDGGPAFPAERMTVVDLMTGDTQTVLAQFPGMSLRDYFAARANETDIEQYRDFYFCEETCDFAPKYTREQAKYRYADAMLEARKVQP